MTSFFIFYCHIPIVYAINKTSQDLFEHMHNANTLNSSLLNSHLILIHSRTTHALFL